MDDIGMIRLIISTLNDIEVKGSENMNKLLGCINALTQIVNQPKEEETVINGGELNGEPTD